MHAAVHCTLIAAFAMTLVSCHKPDAAGASGKHTEAKELIPFEVGKRWSYVSTLYDSLGNPVRTRRASTTVLCDTMLEGERWYRLRDDSAKAITNAANGQDGLSMLADNGQRLLLYKYPANVGDECMPYVVASTDTTVSCGIGQFKCYRYQNAFGGKDASGRRYTMSIDDYVAPGVGLIRHEVWRVWVGPDSTVSLPGGSEITVLQAM